MSERPRGLTRRVATAAVMLPLLTAVIWLAPARVTVAVIGAAMLRAGFELLSLIRARGLPVFPISTLILGVDLFLEVAGVASWPPIWPLALMLFLVNGTLTRADPAEALAGVATGATGALYLGTFGGLLAGLRWLPPESDGPGRLLLLLAVMMAADSAAYFGGSAFGRRPLVPRLSPAKTMEGALAALGGGLVAAIAFGQSGLIDLPLAHAIGLGLGLSVLGVLGDLFESLLKRWAGVKDAGELFPGHGGMLDRLDSLLFGAPLLYHYFRLVS